MFFDKLGRLLVSPVASLFNGTDYEPQHGNTEGTALASAARTATTYAAAPITNTNARGIMVWLNITAASGTGGLTIRVRGYDPVSGLPAIVSTNGNNYTTTGLKYLVLYPGKIDQGALTNDFDSGPLPRTFDVGVQHGDASSYTYSLGYSLIV